MILCKMNKTALTDNLIIIYVNFMALIMLRFQFTKNLNFFSTPLSEESPRKVIGSYKQEVLS